ncbi:Proton-coupled amino acid transporter-like protein [Pseudolycoriella hygida]|uniref:Proton-coupled amino acid transporter-like protein n=1 Tax=Pseudolycoriella hygida TaxID=35572 RepID=A0A9Q0MZG2_9DIPT|nr:Proton-coupled amino acid transporter-like protein [Pseudolycoriella hygida]
MVYRSCVMNYNSKIKESKAGFVCVVFYSLKGFKDENRVEIANNTPKHLPTNRKLFFFSFVGGLKGHFPLRHNYFKMKENKVELQDLNAEAPMLNKDDVGEDYDPHLHRVIPNATSNTQTLIHLLKGSLGTGILAMPQAFYYAGYASGILNTIFITFISTYCLLVLAKNQYILCKRHRLPMLSYPISMKMALQEGPLCLRWLSIIAIPFVDGFLIVYQAGICCVYIVFVAANIKTIADTLGFVVDVKIHMVILLVPLILLMCVRNLKLLAPLSLFSNGITFVGVGLIFYYFLRDGLNVDDPANPPSAFNSFANFPLFFGTTLFAINAVGVVIAVENNMKTPKSFNMVMIVAMTIICLLYAVFGLIGYLKYGKYCKGSVTLNLPETEVIARSIQAIFALATFISYGLQGYVPVSIVWGYLSKSFENSNKQIYYEFAVRIGTVLVTFAFAALIPLIGLFISLVGALCISVLGIAKNQYILCKRHRLPMLSITQIIQIIFVIATFISYGLQGYVPVSITWGYLSRRFDDSNKLYYEFAVRIGIVLVTFAFAALIPYIGLFISLVGALCISMLGIVCPALMEICVLHKKNLSVLTVAKNVFLIIVGAVGLVVGTYTSVSNIIAEISK